MDTDEIVDGLRGLDLVEPELGFDPDKVADRGARRQRARRVAVLSGVVVGVVAVAAVTFGIDLTSTERVTAGPPPATSVHPPDDLPAQAARNTRHLREVLGRLLPDAEDITVSGFKRRLASSNDVEWAVLNAGVWFRDDAGPAFFLVSIAGPNAAGLPNRCDPDAPPPPRSPRLPDGRLPHCKNVPQPDGSNVILRETSVLTWVDGTKTAVFGLNASYDRKDGGTVQINNDRIIAGLVPDDFLRTDDASVRPRNPLTEQQLLTLVTDPELKIE